MPVPLSDEESLGSRSDSSQTPEPQLAPDVERAARVFGLSQLSDGGAYQGEPFGPSDFETGPKCLQASSTPEALLWSPVCSFFSSPEDTEGLWEGRQS